MITKVYVAGRVDAVRKHFHAVAMDDVTNRTGDMLVVERRVEDEVLSALQSDAELKVFTDFVDAAEYTDDDPEWNASTSEKPVKKKRRTKQ